VTRRVEPTRRLPNLRARYVRAVPLNLPSRKTNHARASAASAGHRSRKRCNGERFNRAECDRAAINRAALADGHPTYERPDAITADTTELSVS
jgi:hypothetical protein